VNVLSGWHMKMVKTGGVDVDVTSHISLITPTNAAWKNIYTS
jgi:hypothetical protein